MRSKVLLGLGLLLLLAAPVAHAIYVSERAVSGRYKVLASALPAGTTELMAFFSVEEIGGDCVATAAKQFATNDAPADVAAYFESRLPQAGHHQAAWFSRRKVVVRDFSTQSQKVFSKKQLDLLPFASRFLINVHAFLPEGASRVVISSSQAIDNALEPRCW